VITSDEPDLKEYWIYRTEVKENIRDIRLMEKRTVKIRPQPTPDEVVWTDHPAPPMRPLYYSVVAIDNAGNMSPPSDVVTGRAFSQTSPEPPKWVSAKWKVNKSAIELAWSLQSKDLQVRVQRRLAGMWVPATHWLPAGETKFSDDKADDSVANKYRLQVRNNAGNTNIKFVEKEVPSPS
jgi:hypothetical protein